MGYGADEGGGEGRDGGGGGVRQTHSTQRSTTVLADTMTAVCWCVTVTRVTMSDSTCIDTENKKVTQKHSEME